MKAKRCTFRNAIIQIDGHKYRGCRFEDCQLVYAGGDLPSMMGCEFHRCRWTLDDAAGRTLRLMKAMVERGGAMRALVERSLGIAGDTATAPPGETMVDKNLH